MLEAQIQLEKNRLMLYETEKKKYSKLARHYFNLVQIITKRIEEMEAELKSENEAIEE